MSATDYLKLSEPVADALAEGRPVVALESTIITHGMPYPKNLEMARSVEAVVTANGATPATIALMQGQMMAGLADTDLEQLANSAKDAEKASRRDLAAILSGGGTAGTTVATTMQISALAGIKIFATGGIGGVHRGASETFDISADLRELAITPVGVVCAGAKSLLDIAKTLEVLETNGVPVVGYRAEDFPAFYVRDSGHKRDRNFNTPDDLAAMLRLQWALGMGGVLIANPIPQAYEMQAAPIEATIAEAIADAEKRGIHGKALTPFLLQRIFELSGGESLKANIALVENNAAAAAEIAVALARLDRA